VGSTLIEIGVDAILVEVTTGDRVEVFVTGVALVVGSTKTGCRVSISPVKTFVFFKIGKPFKLIK
jgi:hypothetical protein